MSTPTLAELWSGAAVFRSEDPRYVAQSIDLPGNGRLGLAHLASGRIVAIYRTSYRGDDGLVHHQIRCAFSDDGVHFQDDRIIATSSPWGGYVCDPAVLILTIKNLEYIFVFYEAGRRRDHASVVANTGVMWSSDQGNTWTHNPIPLTDSEKIPDWGRSVFRGTSVPSAILALDQEHVWVYWTGLYGGPDVNHAEVGAGYIGIVDGPGGSWRRLDQNGVLDRHPDGALNFTIDQPQRDGPVLHRGPFHYCQGSVDLCGNVAAESDGKFYTVFRSGTYSEGCADDFFSASLARTAGYVWFEKQFESNNPPPGPYGPQPILVGNGVGVGYGIAYPWLFKHGESWYLYYVIDRAGGPVEFRSSHYRLKLVWS